MVYVHSSTFGGVVEQKNKKLIVPLFLLSFHTIILYTVLDINSITTHSPVAQVEVEAKMRKMKAEIDDLMETIKGYEVDYMEGTVEDRKEIRQMIIAARTNLHYLYEELKALRGNEQNPSIHFMVLSHPIESLVACIAYFYFVRLISSLLCSINNTQYIIIFNEIIQCFYCT
jgi:hypothetical protein